MTLSHAEAQCLNVILQTFRIFCPIYRQLFELLFHNLEWEIMVNVSSGGWI